MLYHGDCLDIMPTLPDKSVDMVLCDLPYGTTNCKWDSPIYLPLLWQQWERVCKPSAAIVLFAQTPFDKVLGAHRLELLRYELIWEKGHATGHLNAKKAPLKAHENILVFYRQQPIYNPQKTNGHVRKTATKRGDKTEVYGKQTFEELPYDSTERYPRSVLKFSSDKQRSNLHPTQKPLALCEYLIRTYTNDGDTVLDNCMGSGTSCLAAKSTGRRFIGIEKEQKYFDIAKDRLS